MTGTVLRIFACRYRRSKFAPVALLMAVAAGAGFGQPAEETRIREARAASNRAIAVHDLDGIERHWMETVHIVTSTSAQATGRAGNRARMARQFSSRPDTVYVRTPSTIEVFGEWDVASERGEWTGKWTEPDGQVLISGTYLAQWRKVDGQWRIQAELFVPTRCSGARYCATRP